MNRHTFVVQVHPKGVSTLENLATHERVRIAEVSAVGPQIERWLGELGVSPTSASTSPAQNESDPGSAP